MRRVVNPQAKRELQRLLKEVETYQYIHSQPVLTAFTDENWIELVKRSTIGERVTYLRYVAMRQARALLDEQKRKQKEEDEKTRLKNIGAKFEAGEMAYGPGGYELVKDPRESRKRMRQVEGARVCSSMRMDLPGIVVDLQGFTAQQPRPYSLMMRQIQYMMMANFETRPAMPLSFYGLHPDDSKANDVRQKLFGYYEAEFVNQMVLPDLHMEPASALKQNRKKVVYINNKATRMLDGPLDADFYVFAAVRDHGQTGFSSARSNGIPVYRLPIHRYVDWKSGHQALPINNIVRILREVFHSGGDWRSAFLNNLSYKNLTSMAERLEKNPVAVKEFQENTRQLQEAVQLITEATRDM
ncbi:hypothetical protein L596_016434 [Steinernema carpocapsae]|uniref:SAM-dependent MTase TRM10-type domain-containing protein n=1 Tax=Steinernema carpocapsae TaxID=34508 RepID=A0A4U5NIV1_STECR|nr:hypothetical protein L596_016434 [Steinernema carpocapsae]